MTDRIIVVARKGKSQCYTIYHPRGIAPAIQSGGRDTEVFHLSSSRVMTTICGNTDTDGNAKAITAGCYKYGGATLLNWGGDDDLCNRNL